MPSETEGMKLEVTPWTAENQISSLEQMCIKWLNLNEITSHPRLLWTPWAVTPSTGTPGTNTLHIMILYPGWPLSLFSDWIRRRNNTKQPGHRHTLTPWAGWAGWGPPVWLPDGNPQHGTSIYKILNRPSLNISPPWEMSDSTSIN